MLSKVLSSRDAAKAQPIVYSTVTGGGAAPAQAQFSRNDAAPERESHALREKVRLLEEEAAALRHDSFEAGRAQGEQQTRADLAPVMERLNASIIEIAGMRQEIRRRAEKDVVELSLLIARRVLHRELSVDSSALTALARVVFERMARAESYLVVVHPQFAAAVTAALSGSQSGHVRIEPDPDCAPGTLIVRTGDGVIDASVDTQLEEITRGLTDRLLSP